MLLYKNKTYPIGSYIKFLIRGEIVDGRLHFDGYTYYACHNDSNFCGNISPERYEYTYSWSFRAIDGNTLSDEVSILSGIDMKDKIEIEKELSDILNSFHRDITGLMALKDVLPSYNIFRKSSKRGLIEMVNDKDKTVEIKFGRFLRSISNVSKSFDFTEKEIETYHNRYLSYQSGDDTKLSYHKGADILKLYDSNNYLLHSSRLGKSCMNNKFEYLSLYSNNPDVVEAISITKYDKIVGRAILWTLTDGRKILDRTYTCSDWVDEKFIDEIKDKNYLSVYTFREDLKIQLKLDVLDDKVPYLDTFYLYNPENGELSNYMTTKKLKTFRYTNGSYS